MKIDPAKDHGELICPSCGCKVPANTNSCVICKYPFPRRPKSRRILLAAVAIAVAIAFLVWIM